MKTGFVEQSPLERYGFLSAPESRRLRGRRIVNVLADFGGIDIGSARVLDVGCSAGLVTEEIAQTASCVIGIDVDLAALEHATRRGGAARYVGATAALLPFCDATFDAVVCNHVYEHVPDVRALLRELRRVLRPGGVCYFSGGHTLQIIEPHYRLPLLSWLPRRWASAWVRRRGLAQRYDEAFVAPWRLRGLFEGFSAAELISSAMLREPGRYGFPRLAQLPRALRKGVAASSEVVARLAPTWIFLLRR